MGKEHSKAKAPDDAAGAAKQSSNPVAEGIAKGYKSVKLVTGAVVTYFSKQDRPLKGAYLLENRVELSDPIDVACAVISSWVYTHGQKLANIKEKKPDGVAPYWFTQRGVEVNWDWDSPDGLIQDGTACPMIDEGTSENEKTKEQVSWVKLRYLGRAVYFLKEDVMIRDRPSADWAEARKELRRLFMERGLTAIQGDCPSDGINLEIQDATFLSAGALANSCAAVKIIAKIKDKTEKYMVVVWQGTDFAQRPMDVITDLSAAAVSSCLWHETYPELKVHSGMAARVQSDKLDYKSLIENSMKGFFGEEPGTVVFTGHSLGGGCALVAHMAARCDDSLSGKFKNVELRSVVFAAPSPFYMHAQQKKEGEKSAYPTEAVFANGSLVRVKNDWPSHGITNDHVGIVQSTEGTKVRATFHCGLVEWEGERNDLADGHEDTEKMKCLKQEFRRTSINYVCDKDVVPRLPAHIDWVRPMLKPVIRETIFSEKKPTGAVIEWFDSTVQGLLDSFTDMGAWRNTRDSLLNYFHMSTIRYYAFHSEKQEIVQGIEVFDLNSGKTLPQHEKGDDLTYLGSCHSFFPVSVRLVGKPDNWFELNEEQLTQKAHELLDEARDMGIKRQGCDQSIHERWEKIYDALRLWPDTMKRPKPRRWSLLHQAIYWGSKQMVVDLLDEFRADIKETAIDTDGKEMTVLQVVSKSMEERGLVAPKTDEAWQERKEMLEVKEYLEARYRPDNRI